MKTKLVIIFLFLSVYVHAQKLGVYSAAFYNLENLFHYEDSGNTRDAGFSPEGAYHWTAEKYYRKLDNLAYVLSKIGLEHCPAGPAIIGVAEVENRRVLEDLIARNDIAARQYGVVHYNSPDRRGIDVALLYNPALFTVTSSRTYRFNIETMPAYVTRDQLLVSGVMAGDAVHIIVCHWPSRYGGASSSILRERSASISKHIVDSIYRADPNAKIVFMGDLNDNPDDVSCRIVLNAKMKQKDVKTGGLFNTVWEFHEKGIGTLGYLGAWSLFDQIIISEPLLGKDYTTLKFWKSEIFNRNFLIQQEGKNKGYPQRTFAGETFINGYSDHFPVLMYLVKRVE